MRRPIFTTLLVLLLSATAALANNYTGIVDGIDPVKRLVSIKINGKSEIFGFRKDASITVKGNPASVEDIAKGLELRISCEPKTRVIVQAAASEPPPPPAPPPEKKPTPRRDRSFNPSRFAVGLEGTFGESVKVLTVVDKENMICRLGEDFWVSGYSTAGMVDGRNYELSGKFKVVSTKRYKTALSGSRTIFLIEPVKEP